MAGWEAAALDSAGEHRSFEHGFVDVTNIAGHTVGRATLEPGWRWSTCVKPIAKTEFCQAAHIGYAIGGQLAVAMDDGTTFRLRAGEAYRIDPGHDAWVEGDEPWVAVEFESLKDYAK